MKINEKTKYCLEYCFSIIVIVISAVLFALAVNVFISPNHLVSGGASGISIIIGRIIHSLGGPAVTVTTGILNLLLNIPLLLLSWFKLSRRFTILTAIHVVVSSATMSLLKIDNNFLAELGLLNLDFLDIALFAGVLSGVATAIAFMAGGSAAGIDILSVYLSSRKQMTIGKLNGIGNAMIILLNTALFFDETGLTPTLYTLIYTFVNAIVIDTLYIRNKKTVITIITTKGEEISKMIMSQYYRGVTILDAQGAYTGTNKKFLYVVASSFESVDIGNSISKIDEHAFVSVLPVAKIYGSFINKDVH